MSLRVWAQYIEDTFGHNFPMIPSWDINGIAAQICAGTCATYGIYAPPCKSELMEEIEKKLENYNEDTRIVIRKLGLFEYIW